MSRTVSFSFDTEEEKNAAWNWKPEYEKEIARLRKALEWYAIDITIEDFDRDMGRHAHEALEGK